MSIFSQLQPVIEGAFQHLGELYHIKSKINYNRLKKSDDPLVNDNAKMIIYRESDDITVKRGESAQHTCGFDNYAFNQLQTSYLNATLSKGLLDKRDRIGCPKTKKSNFHVIHCLLNFYKK